MLPINKCTIATHDEKAPDLPLNSFLIKSKGKNKGLGSIVLDADNLEDDLIEELLDTEGSDWIKEFAEIKASEQKHTRTRKHTRTMDDYCVMET